MSTKPIGIVVESGCIVGVVNGGAVAIHIIDLDSDEIFLPFPMTEEKYRDYTGSKNFDDRTGSSPYQNQPAREA